MEFIHEQRTVADACELLPDRIDAAVVDVEGLGEVDVVAEEVHPLGLDDEEELVAGDRDARLGGDLDGGGGLDHGGDGEGDRVDDGGAADVLLEDEELAAGVVDAAGVAVGQSGDRGPGGGRRRVGGAEEEALAAGHHDAVRRPVPGQVVGLLEEGRERRERAGRAGEGVDEGSSLICRVGGEGPPMRGRVEAAAAVVVRRRVGAGQAEVRVDSVLPGAEEESGRGRREEKPRRLRGRGGRGGPRRQAPGGADGAEPSDIRELGDPTGDVGEEIGGEVGPAHGGHGDRNRRNDR